MRTKHPHHIELESLLSESFHPVFLDVIDESHMHARGTGTHYKVIMVCDQFTGKNLVSRQREVYSKVKSVFPIKIHALSLKLFTESEWSMNPEIPASPKCAGQHPD